MENKNQTSAAGSEHLPQSILYNVTMKMDKSIAPDCLQWLVAVHAPQMVATGCFTHFKMFHLMEMDDAEGATYAIQYFGNSIHEYHRFADELKAIFLDELHMMWGNGIAVFGTVMRAVN